MKVLKTIVATAVIVFALTTVAMAGVQHFTKQGGQATGSQAQAAQPTYTVTLTAAQLAQLMNGGRAATTGGTQHAPGRRSTHAKAARRADAAATTPATRTHASASGSGGHAPLRGHAPRRAPRLAAATTPRRVITPATVTADRCGD